MDLHTSGGQILDCNGMLMLLYISWLCDYRQMLANKLAMSTSKVIKCQCSVLNFFSRFPCCQKIIVIAGFRIRLPGWLILPTFIAAVLLFNMKSNSYFFWSRTGLCFVLISFPVFIPEACQLL